MLREGEREGEWALAKRKQGLKNKSLEFFSFLQDVEMVTPAQHMASLKTGCRQEHLYWQAVR